MKLKMRPIRWSTGQGKAQYSRSSEDAEDEEEESEDDDDEEVVMHLSLQSLDIPLVGHRQIILGMG